MTIISAWLISAIFFTSVNAQEVVKYIPDKPDPELSLTLFVNDNWTIHWFYRCKHQEFRRPYLAGPFPLTRGSASYLFPIDYGSTKLPAIIRDRCPLLYRPDGLQDGDLGILKFLTHATLETALRGEWMRFVSVDTFYVTPYRWNPGPDDRRYYDIVYLVYGRSYPRVELWVTVDRIRSLGLQSTSPSSPVNKEQNT
ncbi:hypothetical protein FOZ61_003908 [Perkinsus olseni]|uniref:Uncharacterized protein n=1 Tax=Perkinsus olseni TaxID=32597 RepID=A0A7J6L355_PEROL|nr:hypothetical protein FOL46_009373 [Perkinsus olseni]KAF4660590.1 hypothetical protein FOZ61_003908 [Perkinsus olseni]